MSKLLIYLSVALLLTASAHAQLFQEPQTLAPNSETGCTPHTAGAPNLEGPSHSWDAAAGDDGVGVVWRCTDDSSLRWGWIDNAGTTSHSQVSGVSDADGNVKLQYVSGDTFFFAYRTTTGVSVGVTNDNGAAWSVNTLVTSGEFPFGVHAHSADVWSINLYNGASKLPWYTLDAGQTWNQYPNNCSTNTRALIVNSTDGRFSSGINVAGNNAQALWRSLSSFCVDNGAGLWSVTLGQASHVNVEWQCNFDNGQGYCADTQEVRAGLAGEIFVVSRTVEEGDATNDVRVNLCSGFECMARDLDTRTNIMKKSGKYLAYMWERENGHTNTQGDTDALTLWYSTNGGYPGNWQRLDIDSIGQIQNISKADADTPIGIWSATQDLYVLYENTGGDIVFLAADEFSTATATQNVEATEFDTGIKAFVQNVGFKTPTSQFFVGLILMGSAFVAYAFMGAQIADIRTRLFLGGVVTFLAAVTNMLLGWWRFWEVTLIAIMGFMGIALSMQGLSGLEGLVRGRSLSNDGLTMESFLADIDVRGLQDEAAKDDP